MPPTVVLLLGWALALTGAVVSVPQALRTLRTGDARGLSLTTQVCWVSSWAMWLSYSLTIMAWPKVGAESVGLLAEVALTALLMRALHRGGQLRRSLLAALPLAVAGTVGCLAARSLLGVEALAGALTVFDGVSLAPALWATWRSPSLAGLSGPSWALRTVVAAGWIVYGVGFGHPLAAGWAYVMCPAAAVVSLRIRHDRRRIV